MEFKQLEAFVTVMDMKSFSRAAEKLFITQPTVSTQIASLERELNTKLLIRSFKDVHPTKEGRIFYRYAQELLERRDQALLSLQNSKSPLGGVISIAASSIPIRHYLPQMITAFQKLYRNVSFRIYYYCSSVQIVENVIDEKVELGITGIYVHSPQCEIQHMAYDRWVIITPNNDRYRSSVSSSGFPFDRLIQERFICRERGSGTRKDMDHFLTQLGIDPSALNVIAEIDDTDSIIEMVAQGLGISIVSQKSAETFCKFGKILSVNFDGIVPSREIYLVRNQNISLSVIAQKFYDFAINYYAI